MLSLKINSFLVCTGYRTNSVTLGPDTKRRPKNKHTSPFEAVATQEIYFL